MAHENDPDKGGCTFDSILKATPRSLVEDNLYGPLAIAMHSGKDHREVSIQLLAVGFGARTAVGSSRWVAWSIVKGLCCDVSFAWQVFTSPLYRWRQYWLCDSVGALMPRHRTEREVDCELSERDVAHIHL